MFYEEALRYCKFAVFDLSEYVSCNVALLADQSVIYDRVPHRAREN